MAEHDADDPDSRTTFSERYHYTEYRLADSSISVVKDLENEHAWIQSTHAVTVEP